MNRKYQQIKNYPGIYRILTSENGVKWAEPTRGKKFAATKYMKVNGSSKRLKESFDSFEDAKNFRDNKIENCNSTYTSFLSRNNEPRITLSELFESYSQNEFVHLSIVTQDKYKSYCRHFLPLWNQSVESISVLKISEWLAWLKHPYQMKTYRNSRCNFEHEYTFLKTLLSYYRETFNFEYRMPFLKRHRDNLIIKESRLNQKDLSTQQIRRFFDALKNTGDEYFYFLAAFQYFSFSRLQDTVALHYEDFDFQSGIVNINKKIVFRRTGECERLLVQGSKVSKGKCISISPQLNSLFKEWTMKSGIRNGPLFQISGEWPTYRVIQYAYDSAFRKAGIPFTGTHILRHAALSEAQETSGDIRITQALAGHKNITTTQIYAKARDTNIKEVQIAMGNQILA